MKRWARTELERDRQTAIQTFVRERLGEPLDVYTERFDDARDAVETLLESTLDLTLLLPANPAPKLRERLREIVTDREQFTAFRYLAGPPISADDLGAVADVASLAPSKIAEDAAGLDALAQTVLDAHDRRRFPWLMDEREPTPQERDAAIVATAALVAYQGYLSWRRHESGADQEALVADALAAIGYAEVAPRTVSLVSDGPGPGEFCRESKVLSEKADVLVRLPDRRLMLIECKVSNSSVNSYKRLNREAGGKAAVWVNELGSQGVVPAAVLGGVYALRSLEQAQDRGLSLFWAHSLGALTEWVQAPTR